MSKQSWRFFLNFVAFSEYLNFAMYLCVNVLHFVGSICESCECQNIRYLFRMFRVFSQK